MHFSWKLMTVKEITDIINNLKSKSSSGVAEMSNKVIKHIQEIIAQPITIIINYYYYYLLKFIHIMVYIEQ